METSLPFTDDRVRRHTAEKVNEKIDRHTEENIRRYISGGDEAICKRLAELDNEWDIERALEVTSGLNVLTGLTLGLLVNKKWLILSAVSSYFLIRHATKGWCPPMPLFRRLGFRTRDEINNERMALRKKLSIGKPVF